MPGDGKERNMEAIREQILKMLREDKDFRREVALLIQSEELVTKTYLDEKLLELEERFNKRLTDLGERFNQQLLELEQRLTERFNRQILELEQRLTERFNRQILELAERFDRQLLELEQRLTEQFNQQILELDRRFTQQLIELERRFTDMLQKMTEAFDHRLLQIDKKFTEQLQIQEKRFRDTIKVIGGRWGVDNERAIRKGMRIILEKEFGAKVQRWRYKGIIKEINPRREEYEADILISDDKVIIVEVKGSVQAESIEKFEETALAYEYVTGRKPDRKIIITPFIYQDAEELAQKYGIEVSEPPDDYYRLENLDLL